MPRQAEPRIGTANDLLSGEVVYLSHDGVWGRSLADAAVSLDTEALAALAREASQKRQVVDPDFIPVALDASGLPRPISLREIIRDRGPTVRPDLGRQNEAVPRHSISL